MGQITGRDQEVFDALKYRTEVDEHGNRFYCNNAGEWHRENGPAIEWSNGTKIWYQNGQLHRIGGPAIVCTNGHKEWWQNGRRHRTDAQPLSLPMDINAGALMTRKCQRLNST